MFSEAIRTALDHEVIGQPHAVNSVVRGVTRLLSGLTPQERSWCAYLFIGPPGTGRTHLVRTLARLVHGREHVHTLNCNTVGHSDPWSWWSHQLAPLFFGQQGRPGLAHEPARILLVQSLECAPPAFFPILARVLETGQVSLPGDRPARLDDCMIFLTTGLCTEVIMNTSRFGFASGTSPEGDGGEHDAAAETCRAEAERVFGLDLLGQLDDLIVFRRLEEELLARVLERHFERMSRWLEHSGVHCALTGAAEAYLLETSKRKQDHLGTRNLLLTHRREVEFPLADLLMSGRLGAGSEVTVDHRSGEQHLHFTVRARAAAEPAYPAHVIPVTAC